MNAQRGRSGAADPVGREHRAADGPQAEEDRSGPARKGQAPHLDLWLGAGPDGRVRILRRHVAWPWSLPRGFFLQGPDGPLTLLPQATAAALLPGDDWRHRIRLDAGRVHLLSAGAMAVHGGGDVASAAWDFSVAPGACLAQMPDPAVMFGGARLRQSVVAEVAEGATFLLMDGMCRRDPVAAALDGHWSSDLLIRRPDGVVLLQERQAASEALLADVAGLPGGATAFGTLIAVVPPEVCIALERHLPPGRWDRPGVWGGVGGLRGGHGLVLRLAARSGGLLSAAFGEIRAALAPVL